MLNRTELEHLSLIYYIKEVVLAGDFSQEVQNIPLILDPNLYNGTQRSDYKIISPEGPFGNLHSSKGRGLLSFELRDINPCLIYNSTTSGYVPIYGTPFEDNSFYFPMEREATLVTVRDQLGSVMDRSWYQLDYNKGRIRFPAPTTPTGVVASGLVPTTIDYRFHMVSVLDGWPTQESVPELPIVSIYPDKQTTNPLQIGPGVKFEKKYNIDIFATSNANRRNLIGALESGLYNKHTPVLDFNRSGQPLNHWGTINENFIQDIQLGTETYRSYLTLNPGNGSVLYFVSIEVLYDTSPRGNMSDSMRHMAKIRLTTCSQTDRDLKLVGKFNELEAPPGGLDSLIKKGYTT